MYHYKVHPNKNQVLLTISMKFSGKIGTVNPLAWIDEWVTLFYIEFKRESPYFQNVNVQFISPRVVV